jgi:isochorismate hydrolase
MAVWDDVLDDTDVEGHLGNQIVAEVAPRPGDLLVEKKKPSAFFGTPLVSYLVALRADTVLELDEVLAYLDGLEPGLFDAEFPPAREARGAAR